MLDRLIEGDDGESALLVAGPPRCGKTEFAYDALIKGLRALGGEAAVMSVSNRTLAGELSDRAVRRMGALGQARPVTTLSALAFRVIAAERFAAHESEPKLLNGAEQDALLRQVLAAHLVHAQRGELCDACRLLRAYFAQDDWAHAAAPAADSCADGSTTAAMFANGVSGAFINQLRDMLARMDELGASFEREDELLGKLHADSSAALMGGIEHLETQWRLAFALRREYAEAIRAAYPREYRLDASRLLVEGADALRRCKDQAQSLALPDLLIVDDFQDTTFAGLRFIEALRQAGTRVVLVGNPDEAVQTFRGSYPEYLFAEAQRGPLRARLLKLEARAEQDDTHTTYRDVVAARVSLSIPSPEAETAPLPQRPGKLPQVEGTLPIRPVGKVDDSLNVALYRSPREELDDVVWRIKRARLDGRATWNDMAVIAHDNATVRVFGERLRRDGVPVRYSSVTRPLNSEPFVQGLFALIELARLRRQGLAGTSMSLAEVGAFARLRVATLMSCPLITTGAKPGEGTPARIEAVESAMNSLESLANLQDVTPDALDAEGATALPQLVAAWHRLVAQRASEASPASVQVDDSLFDPSAADASSFGTACQYAMLALDEPQAPAADALALIAQVLGDNPQLKAFQRVWKLVDRVARESRRLTSNEPQFTLALAWQTTGVALAWQRAALRNTSEGRAANDRLDVAMRLFQYAQDGAAGHDIVSFIAQVRGMELEADSLAHVGPIEQAVTLTTPAGAAGRHWEYVWMPAIQQDVWPNLAERATLFGGEDLAEVILHGGVQAAQANIDPRLSAVLSSEKKSLLVALTRADRTVNLSAVWNDDLTPSDFLYGYLPEQCPRNREQITFAVVGDENAGLDADPRGLVAAARVRLAQYPADSPEGQDAAATLALLSEHSIEAADPGNWSFVENREQSGQSGQSEATQDNTAAAPAATLSPSAVDQLWGCPVCWLLENRFAGPKAGSAATSFGTLIHTVAEQGSKEGLDLPDFMAGKSVEERMAAAVSRLLEIYNGLKPDLSTITNPRERYSAMRKDDQAEATLANIASYFVRSNTADYLGKNAEKFSIGTLQQASCEEQFSARFDMGDILAAYNALPGMDSISRSDLCELMGFLVGGWPEGMREDLVVRLSGRIDRKETRLLEDGTLVTRLIDYKTGRVPSVRQIVNDLQLVCYQLGLAFPEQGEREACPQVTQSALFHVGHKASPAESYAPEGLFQPPLFTGASLNLQAFTVRDHYRNPLAMLDIAPLEASKPGELAHLDDDVWRLFMALNGTQALWSLTMIARVFYAAAASRAERLEAHPTAEHLGSCRMNAVCPACAGQIDTVFETRQA
ncbi:PD-(D/E)XK nuclease family protein [Bifidobacterium panos]|uniref:DNA 3'-5' helicase n=1 Tax=Bifidobacterium panos TaxID=2675321 RepID=A0ABX1SUX6_9BIFI|nr:PD-(D/E)XK nuclease family protein [Bifidobacterium sp. DSM 109963]NMN01625.1 ATP-dependent DNA helicase UvrD [Bifidobacterium sp. DSM 109963]